MGESPSAWPSFPRDKPIAVLCHSGARSGRVTAVPQRKRLPAGGQRRRRHPRLEHADRPFRPPLLAQSLRATTNQCRIRSASGSRSAAGWAQSPTIAATSTSSSDSIVKPRSNSTIAVALEVGVRDAHLGAVAGRERPLVESLRRSRSARRGSSPASCRSARPARSTRRSSARPARTFAVAPCR